MAKDQTSDKLEVVNDTKLTEKQDKADKKASKKPAKKNDKKKIANPIKEMLSELKKVTWPTRKELTGYCICVGVFVIVMAVVVWLMDMGSAELIRLLTDTKSGLPSLF